jgi:hypothetical protein
VLQANALTSNKCTKTKNRTQTILSTIVALLVEPLAKKRKTEADHLVIELVLHFIRNLLCAEPIVKPSREVHESNLRLQEELIAALYNELVLEVILVLSQHLDEDAHYNLLIMEIIHHLTKNHDPALVAKYGSFAEESTRKRANVSNTEKNIQPLHHFKKSSALRSVLNKERQRVASQATTTTRHSNFGGTLLVLGPGGKNAVLSSVLQTGGEDFSVKRDEAPNRCAKRVTPFVSESRDHKTISLAMDVSPITNHAYQALHEFSAKFIVQGYKPLMKSLKNEFRRDSARLEAHDKIVFFRMIWFFSKWQRAKNTAKGSKAVTSSRLNVIGGVNQEDESSKVSTAKYEQLVVTMDLFTFQLVLQACDTFTLHKKYHDLAQAVSLYLEMMHVLLDMNSSKDEVEIVMSLGIQHKLFYDNEPLDRLPKLLREWQPGTHSREYSSDLVELSHLTLKLLELNCNANTDSSWAKAREERRQRKKKSKSDNSNMDKVTLMRKEAEEFNFFGYLGALASHKIVGMYTSLLSRYETNLPHINHHIVAFLLRLCKFVVSSPSEQVSEEEEMDGSDTMKAFNQICNRVSTLEPMLFDIRLFAVLNEILNDKCILGNSEFTSLRHFSGTILRHFADAARLNPLLFIEILFKHRHPATFCERVINSYADDELRMLVERDLLSKELLRLEDSNLISPSDTVTKGADYDTSEGEWDDDKNLRGGETGKHSNGIRLRRSAEAESKSELDKDGDTDQSAGEWEDNKNRRSAKAAKRSKGKRSGMSAEAESKSEFDKDGDTDKSEGDWENDKNLRVAKKAQRSYGKRLRRSAEAESKSEFDEGGDTDESEGEWEVARNLNLRGAKAAKRSKGKRSGMSVEATPDSQDESNQDTGSDNSEGEGENKNLRVAKRAQRSKGKRLRRSAEAESKSEFDEDGDTDKGEGEWEVARNLNLRGAKAAKRSKGKRSGMSAEATTDSQDESNQDTGSDNSEGEGLRVAKKAQRSNGKRLRRSAEAESNSEFDKDGDTDKSEGEWEVDRNLRGTKRAWLKEGKRKRSSAGAESGSQDEFAEDPGTDASEEVCGEMLLEAEPESQDKIDITEHAFQSATQTSTLILDDGETNE